MIVVVDGNAEDCPAVCDGDVLIDVSNEGEELVDVEMIVEVVLNEIKIVEVGVEELISSVDEDVENVDDSENAFVDESIEVDVKDASSVVDVDENDDDDVGDADENDDGGVGDTWVDVGHVCGYSGA